MLQNCFVVLLNYVDAWYNLRMTEIFRSIPRLAEVVRMKKRGAGIRMFCALLAALLLLLTPLDSALAVQDALL